MSSNQYAPRLTLMLDLHVTMLPIAGACLQAPADYHGMPQLLWQLLSGHNQSAIGRSSRVALQACAYVPCDTLYNPLCHAAIL